METITNQGKLFPGYILGQESMAPAQPIIANQLLEQGLLIRSVGNKITPNPIHLFLDFDLSAEMALSILIKDH